MKGYLAVDIGNTNINLGFFESPENLIQRFSIFTRSFTEDELFLYINQFISISGINFIPEYIFVSSVVPQLNRITELALSKFHPKILKFLTPKDFLKFFDIKYENIDSIGVDRLVNVLYGIKNFGEDLIIIDVGTATTIDVVVEKTYLGGIIMPGLEMSARVLTERTAKLPKLNLATPKSIVGQKTEDCMLSGIIFGNTFAIEKFVEKITKIYNKNFKKLITGGLGEMILKSMEKSEEFIFDQTLTLKGIILAGVMLKDL